MKAVIVAAGMSTRIKSVVKDRPKSLIEVGDRSLLVRSIENLNSVGIDEIAVVVGHEFKKIESHLGNLVTYVHNPWYATTNNMASLWFARHFVENNEFLYLHSDLLYAQDLLQFCVDKKEGAIVLLVEKKQCVPEDMKVLVSGERFIESSKEIPLDNAFGEWTGIAKFNAEGGQKMFNEIRGLLYGGQFTVYDTAAFNNLARKGLDIRVVLTQGRPWVEIDNPEDLEVALNEILPKIQSQ